ncbi:hypothetical protein GTO10_02010 [Candidatus Saccharibacteria bacterium]|nr:hypothetical protein [Candidatus Saccharibacteria bacterium]
MFVIDFMSRAWPYPALALALAAIVAFALAHRPFRQGVWSLIERFAGWLQTNTPKAGGMVWTLGGKGLGGLAKIVVWVLSKAGVVILLLFLLGILGIAWQIGNFGFQVGVQYEGDAFTTFFKWSALAFALLLGGIVLIPLFATLKKLVS